MHSALAHFDLLPGRRVRAKPEQLNRDSLQRAVPTGQVILRLAELYVMRHLVFFCVCLFSFRGNLTSGAAEEFVTFGPSRTGSFKSLLGK